MMNSKVGLSAAVAIAALIGAALPAAAQETEASGSGVIVKHGNAGLKAGSHRMMGTRPLTIAKPAMAPAPSPLGVITTPIGIAGQIATAPLNGLSQAFGMGPIGGASRPLPIVARYAAAGPVTDSVNQGWAQPVPVSANGPIYKLEPVKNSGGVSPFTLIAAPITAATTLAAAPINAVGSVVGAPPAPPPVF